MSEEEREPWYCIEYDDDDRNMEVEILFTDKESLKALTNQLQEIIDDETDQKEFSIKYSSKQDLTNAPFQKVRFAETPLDKSNIENKKNENLPTGCTFTLVLVVLIVFFFAAYGFNYWLST